MIIFIICIWLLFSFISYGLMYGYVAKYYTDNSLSERAIPLMWSLIGGPISFIMMIILLTSEGINNIKFKL